MRSRLEALNGGGDGPSTSNDNDLALANVKDVERQDTEVDQEMASFIKRIDTGRGYVENIEAKLQLISETHEQALSAISETQKGENQKKADALTSDVQIDGNKVRNLLKQIATENKASKNSNTPLARLKRSQHAALSAKFFDAMNEYNEIQRIHKSKMRVMLSRQLKIAKPDASEEEVNKFLDAGDLNPFSFSTTNTMEMKKALDDVNQRHKELLKLEESMKELQSLFIDMAAMVEQQGALIDQIAFNVGEAEQHTETAKKGLIQAVTYQRAARRKMCYIAIILSTILVIIITIVVVIVLVNRPDNNNTTNVTNPPDSDSTDSTPSEA